MTKRIPAYLCSVALCLCAMSAYASDAAVAAAPAKSAAPAAASTDPASLTKVAESAGYKAREQGGHTVYCRKTQELNSKIPSSVCITPDQVATVVKRTQDYNQSVQELQRMFLTEHPPVEPAAGGKGGKAQ